MEAMQYENLFDACRELFGSEVDTSRDFLHYLQHSGIKSAFRRKAKETHPDTFSGHNVQVQAARAEQFCKAKTAYDLLCRFVSQRETAPSRRCARQTADRPRQAADRPRHRAARESDEYYRGEIPQRPLQIGRYLYYRRVITFRELTQALAWQRGTRRPLGAIAREWGWMTASQVGTVMVSKLSGKFGDKALRLGFLDHSRLRMLLMEQRLRHRRIGHFFIERRLVAPRELDLYLRELRLHNLRVAGTA